MVRPQQLLKGCDVPSVPQCAQGGMTFGCGKKDNRFAPARCEQTIANLPDAVGQFKIRLRGGNFPA
jgi:hypothetical protein